MNYTLESAAAAFPAAVEETRRRADFQFGAGMFDFVLSHWTARRLRCDAAKGFTRDREGIRSQFVDFTPDCAAHYVRVPSHVWCDFFEPTLLNSCSRVSRALNP